jgi:uncharacterized protein YbcI
MNAGQRPSGGELLAAISNAVVGILSDCYGRGPTKAKTYMADDYVLTVLEDLLTPMEQTLVASGREALVRELRVTLQTAPGVSKRFTKEISALVGRQVVAHQTQLTFHPTFGFELFVLEPDPQPGPEE